jgi:hypothetical protein
MIIVGLRTFHLMMTVSIIAFSMLTVDMMIVGMMTIGVFMVLTSIFFGWYNQCWYGVF